MNYEVVRDWKFEPNECKFEPGEIYVTPEAKMLEQSGVDLGRFLLRHLAGDWGDGLTNYEKSMTDSILEEGSNKRFASVVSEYHLSNHRQLSIVTFFDDSQTIIEVITEKPPIDDELMWLIGEWEYLSKEQKKRIMWILRRERIKWWVKRIIPILFLITLVQFIIWLGMK